MCEVTVIRQCLHTLILNVLGELLGIGNLYCMPFYLAGSEPYVRPRDIQNRLPNVVLANLGHPPPLLIVEQTSRALLVDGDRDSFCTAPNGHLLTPVSSSKMATCLGGLSQSKRSPVAIDPTGSSTAKCTCCNRSPLV